MHSEEKIQNLLAHFETSMNELVALVKNSTVSAIFYSNAETKHEKKSWERILIYNTKAYENVTKEISTVVENLAHDYDYALKAGEALLKALQEEQVLTDQDIEEITKETQETLNLDDAEYKTFADNLLDEDYDIYGEIALDEVLEDEE